MKSTWKIVAGLSLLALTMAVILMIPCTRSMSPRVATSGIRLKDVVSHVQAQQSLEDILSHSETIAQNYEEVGQFWTRVLEDSSTNDFTRAYAARMLGTMKYSPAIPALIKHIRLFEGLVYSDGMGDEPFVAKRALVQYGNAAIPNIVQAYLDSTDEAQRGMMMSVIAAGKTQETTRIYVDGLHAQGDMRITSKDLDFFHHFK